MTLPTNFIPGIGDRGFYELAAPFTLTEQKIYTCKAIRKISELQSENQDVFQLYYKAKGIDQGIFEEDQLNDRAIIFLQEDGGSWLNVPVRYLMGYPNMNGVPYQQFSLVVGLPAFPVGTDFALVKQAIQDQVLHTLGVGAAVAEVKVSLPILKTSEEHTAMEADRLLRATAGTDYSRAIEWQAKYNDLKFKYDQLVGLTNWQ